MCFIGHGAFGIITKQIWCNYFAVFGIGSSMAFHLMPLLGTIDILMGLSLLLYPTRVILLWLVLWGIITAMLRPLSGEPFAEFIERAGNYGAPLCLLILSNGKNSGNWFISLIQPEKHAEGKKLKIITICLKIIVFLLLVGHGWLSLAEKKGLLNQYSLVGFSNPVQTAHAIGLFEILAGLSVLLNPVRHILIILFIWKMTSELFYPHWELFEWIERGASYGSILAIWWITKTEKSTVELNDFNYDYQSVL